MKVAKIVKNREKNREKDTEHRGKNSISTHIKPGCGGRPPGAKNRMPPIDLVPQETKNEALLALQEGVAARRPECFLWLLSRMIPPAKPEPERTIINLQFDDLDLSELDGIKNAGVRVAQALANGELSIEETEHVLKILQTQNGLVYNELIERLIKFAREHRTGTDSGGSGKTLITEEEFNKLYDASRRRPIVYQGGDDTK